MANVNIDKKNITIKKQKGSDSGRTYLAVWSYKESGDFKKDNIDSFKFEWQYYGGDKVSKKKIWLVGSSSTTAVHVLNCTYSVPEEATKVRFRVKPVSKKYKENNKDTEYFTSSYSSWIEKSIPAVEKTTEEKRASVPIKNVVISQVPRQERQLIATWDIGAITFEGWFGDPDPIDHFVCEWRQQLLNGIWQEPESKNTAGSSATYRRSEFSYDEHVQCVEFRLRPESKTYSTDEGEFDYVYETWTQWFTCPISMKKDTPPRFGAGYITDLEIKPSANDYTQVYAIWKLRHTKLDENAILHQNFQDFTQTELSYVTDNFSIEWQYFADNHWIDSDTATSSWSSMASPYYTIPVTAEKIRVRVKPNANEEEVLSEYTGSLESVKYYQDTVWSGYIETAVEDQSKEPPAKYDSTITDLTIKIRSLTDSNTLFATWDFYWTNDTEGIVVPDNTKIEGFDVEWAYYMDNTWFSASGGSATSDIWSSTYNLEEGAEKIKVRVMPKSSSYTERGREIKWFTEKWCDWSEFDVPDLSLNDPVPQELSVSDVDIEMDEVTSGKVVADWLCSIAPEQIASFSYEWRILIGTRWYSGDSGDITVTDPNSILMHTPLYQPADDVIAVMCRVKPNPNQGSFRVGQNLQGEDVYHDLDYFSGVWSSWVLFYMPVLPEKPSVPSVKIDKYNLTASVTTYDRNTDYIYFEVVRDNQAICATGTAPVTMNFASYQFVISSGSTYKVRCRGENDEEYGEFSEYTSDYSCIPNAITGDIICRAESSTSAYLEWAEEVTADEYTIEYATDKKFFDVSSEQIKTSTVSINRAIITGLETENEYFFRIKCTNEAGDSSWSRIVMTALGKIPGPPSTWSSSTTTMVGKNVTLYWKHNSEDGARETYAQLELTIDNAVQPIIELENVDRGTDLDREVKSYILYTNSYIEGTSIRWRVRTKGVTDEYGDWSVQRIVEVYAPPVLNLEIGAATVWHWDPFNFTRDSIYTGFGDIVPMTDDIFESFPLFIKMSSSPRTQTPVSYHVSIISNDTYEDVDETGSQIFVIAGQEIFSRHYNSNRYEVMEYLIASDINLENGMSYTINATVGMDSGLTAEASKTFTVSYSAEEVLLDAAISYDPETITTYIRPYCNDANGEPLEGVEMAVYRREFDGSFMLIASGLSNDVRPAVTDPHPSLNYARYRLVAIAQSTGKVYFYDTPAYPIGEIGIIIQWNEQWMPFDQKNEDEFADQPWVGSMLRLPYNVDITDQNDVDVSFVEYIGRKHPVSYYGTQVGQTASWKTEIDAEDIETIYALRRLAVWMGNVYVREPTGVGYWAQVKVSFTKTHNEVVIPVTLAITRVEGGM